jgi:hypothetical protein
MRILFVILTLASLGLVDCSSKAASPAPTIDAGALAAEICAKLTGASSSEGIDSLTLGMKVAIDNWLPVEEYSRALAEQCPARIRRIIGTESFSDWLRD